MNRQFHLNFFPYRTAVGRAETPNRVSNFVSSCAKSRTSHWVISRATENDNYLNNQIRNQIGGQQLLRSRFYEVRQTAGLTDHPLPHSA